jgi:sialate O-acetylesterase
MLLEAYKLPKLGIVLTFFLVFLMSIGSELNAVITMTYPFDDSMVLQRNQNVPVWGVAASGETVTVTFNGQTKSVVTPVSGKWRVVLDPMVANGPLTMTVKGSNTVTFQDVYVGEVWNCGGQSNMDTRLSYYSNYADTVTKANNPLLRYIDVRYTLLGNSNPGWHAITPSTAGGCSATGYFFGKALQQKLGCAVGLLVTAVGGTYIEQWLDPVAFADIPNRVLPVGLITPSDMYQQFVSPVLTYGIKGSVIMLGEQNAGDTLTAPLYGDRLKRLITSWRMLWGQGDSPFYFGQITMFNAKAAPDTLSPIVQVREGQRAAMALPNTGMSVNIDLSGGGWHFSNKYEAGRRLALIALARDYGQTSLEYSGPLYQKMGVQGNKAKVLFSHIGTGMKTSDGLSPTCFFLAGANNIWYPATTAAIEGNMVVLTCTSVPVPKKVCYALGKSPYNLFNKEGLPASPFNSDLQSWQDGINQILTMPETSLKMFGSSDFSPATSSSGLKITYESDNPAVATISSDGLVHLTGAGNCKIKANQLGDAIYRSSVVLTQTITVFKSVQNITFPSAIEKVYGNVPFQLGATSSSSLPVTYTKTSGDAVSLTGDVVTILKAGSATISASQAGNANYFAATECSQNILVSKAPLIISVRDTIKTFNAENPVFSLRYTGFQKTDNVDSLDVKPLVTCSAEKTSPIGEYILSASGALDNNYRFEYLNGKLSVTEALRLNEEEKARFKVYPNPVTNHLTVDLSIPESALSLSVESLNGQKLFAKKVSYCSKMEVDCSALRSGIYLLKVSNDTRVYVTKLVKQ